MERLQDKVAIITGSGSGIGKATAELFAEHGAKVILGDIDESSGQAAADAIGGDATFIHLDTTQEAQWERVTEMAEDRFGRIDIVVNNAGIEGSIDHQNPEDVSLDEIHSVNAVNVEGVLLGCKHGIKAMRDKGGAIVNISSIGGILRHADVRGLWREQRSSSPAHQIGSALLRAEGVSNPLQFSSPRNHRNPDGA